MRSLFALLFAAMLIGCDKSPDQHPRADSSQTSEQRQRETQRIDGILRRQIGGMAEARGDTLILVEPSAETFKSVDEFACGVAQLQIPNSTFASVRLIVLDMENRTEKEQMSLTLPNLKPLPKGCELPPPGYSIYLNHEIRRSA